jgi:hypothetical protein
LKNAVILFVYKRPDHTEKVLEGLKRNGVKELYVFADGAKKDEDIEDVMKTRDLIKAIDWCDVKADYKEKNMGLANSVINGITKVFNSGYDRVIVVEEDCVPKDGFIDFMEKAFDYYEDMDDVMHISGFGLPIKKREDYDVYFTPYPCSWGWGTWKKYWEKCDFTQYGQYKALLSDRNLVKKFNYAGEGFSEFLNKQLNGQVDSWLIRWYFYIFQNSGRCVWSYKSYIENSGFDGSGAHRVRFDRFNQKYRENTEYNSLKFTKDLAYKLFTIREFRRFFMGHKRTEQIKTVLYMLTGIILESKKGIELRNI